MPEVGGTILTTPPLMHVSAQWGVFHSMFAGGRIVFPPPCRFDADAVWSLVAAEGVNILTIVGDAMAVPLAESIEQAAAAGSPYDVSSLIVIGSGGAVLSSAAKAKLTEQLPSVMVVDGFGSSETGILGSKLHAAGDASTAPRFTVNAQTQVLDDAGRPVTPGSGEVGRLARKGHVPLGYYNDESKTAATFLEVDGERWVMPGTMDRRRRRNGRAAWPRLDLDQHRRREGLSGGGRDDPDDLPGGCDVVVVGLPDERWGQRIVAVVAAAPGAEPDLDSLRAHGATALASYKLPREVVLVDTVERTPAGKADYAWARATAEAHHPA